MIRLSSKQVQRLACLLTVNQNKQQRHLVYGIINASTAGAAEQETNSVLLETLLSTRVTLSDPHQEPPPTPTPHGIYSEYITSRLTRYVRKMCVNVREL